MSSIVQSANPSQSTDLARLYDCPDCFGYIFPPILQCSNGHMVCLKCRSRFKNCCPTCKGQLSACRNLALEKALDIVHFPCKFVGCQFTMLQADKIAHEENCLFRSIFYCPCCNWQGAVDQVVPHIRSKHPTMEQAEGDHFIYRLRTNNLSLFNDGHQWARLLHCYGHSFLFILKKKANCYRFLAAVQLIGTRFEADNFSFRIKLDGSRKKIMLEATPLFVIHESLESAAYNQCNHGCLQFECTNDDGDPFSQYGYLNIDVEVVQFSNRLSSEVSNTKTCNL